MEKQSEVVGKLKITREIIQDGVGPKLVQLKVVPEVDKDGDLSGPLISGFKFSVKPSGLIPADFDVTTMKLSGTVTIDLKVEKEVVVPEKKRRSKKE